MRKVGLTIAAALALGSSAYAADIRMPVKAVAPPVVVSPWDFAFGASISSDYRFRGISQSNRHPSVAAYFEPRYNINDTLQLYVGVGGASISFPNRAAAEIDVYGGIRPTFGPVAFDFGVFGYLYPGGRCHYGAAVDTAGNALDLECLTNFIAPSGNVIKKDLDFFEVYGKVLWTVTDQWALGANYYYTPSYLNSGADGHYVSGTAKWTAPGALLPMGLGMYVSGEFGRQFLGTSDSFYGTGIVDPVSGLGPFPFGIDYKDYNTWNVGIGFTYKVFTLDLRYSGTDLKKGDCNAFTSDQTASFSGSFTPINPGGYGSKWCGDAFIAKFSADLVASQHLK
ncbi:TorF family putative porin [Bradyrhizobium sp. LHD-71]|uniref:TorF family putative porin n=1 Tax=Bradyrhizobium sp. LHD-71 TaxID=3072141 RepID=UPI00280CCFA8|nr:TorF family putative porin [Bradyrhizobium sp. LHD-71]MDQ8726775.1 TorF family putative porin [Bradyrhizobium sp. LHD-71]